MFIKMTISHALKLNYSLFVFAITVPYDSISGFISYYENIYSYTLKLENIIDFIKYLDL